MNWTERLSRHMRCLIVGGGLLAFGVCEAQELPIVCVNIDDPRPIADQIVAQGAGRRARTAAGQTDRAAEPEIAPNSTARVQTTPPAEGPASLLVLTQAQVELLRRVRNRLSEVALMLPAVLVCGNEEVNAYAVPRGRGVPPSGLILMSDALMQLVGMEESSAAALLSHEMAHLLESHGDRQARFDGVAARKAIEIGVQQEAERPGTGAIVARQAYAAASRAYGRELEYRADLTGYRIYQEAGFDPRIVTRLFETLRAYEGDQATSYLGTHPGMADRISRLYDIARDDAARTEAVAKANAVSAESERYAAKAREYLQQRRWRELSAFVARWLAELPESGLGWYYRGVLMRGSKQDRERAWTAFARAAELDPTRDEIWIALVESLLASGYREEAVRSVAAMGGFGHRTGGLIERLFKDQVWVHGEARLAPRNLWWAHDESGQRFISNDKNLFANRGLEGQKIPPEWVPVE